MDSGVDLEHAALIGISIESNRGLRAIITSDKPIQLENQRNDSALVADCPRP